MRVAETHEIYIFVNSIINKKQKTNSEGNRLIGRNISHRDDNDRKLQLFLGLC